MLLVTRERAMQPEAQPRHSFGEDDASSLIEANTSFQTAQPRRIHAEYRESFDPLEQERRLMVKLGSITPKVSAHRPNSKQYCHKYKRTQGRKTENECSIRLTCANSILKRKVPPILRRRQKAVPLPSYTRYFQEFSKSRSLRRMGLNITG